MAPDVMLEQSMERSTWHNLSGMDYLAAPPQMIQGRTLILFIG